MPFVRLWEFKCLINCLQRFFPVWLFNSPTGRSGSCEMTWVLSDLLHLAARLVG